jgi:hypothetical protein
METAVCRFISDSILVQFRYTAASKFTSKLSFAYILSIVYLIKCLQKQHQRKNKRGSVVILYVSPDNGLCIY